VESLREFFESGKPAVLVDRKRENEADFVFPAQLITEEVANFFVTHGKGLFCVAADEEDLLRRGFVKLSSNYQANYFLPVDWGSGTGISASERAETCRKVAEGKFFHEFRYPGHVAVLGGVGFQRRQGHTEASLEIVQLAGYNRYAVIIEILSDRGDSHDLDFVFRLAEKFSLPVLEMEEVWQEFIRKKQLITKKAEANLPTDFGVFKIVSFENHLDNKEHFAVVKEPFGEVVPVRIHSECVTGDVLSSLKCDCGSQLANFLRYMSAHGGILIYLRQEGRGIGLSNKIAAYSLQDKGLDTVEANRVLGFSEDERDYAPAVQILKALGIERVLLFTNNQRKTVGLEKYGIEVVETKRLYGRVTPHNRFYLSTKMKKLGHELEEIFREVNS